MEKPHIKTIVLIIVLFFTSCETPLKEDNEDKFKTFYHYDTCVTPISSGVIRKYELTQYQPPELIYNYLDSIIIQEENCPCYRNSATGFSVEFVVLEHRSLIGIEPLRKIFIGNYSKYNGFFVHNKHYFFCYGTPEQFLLKEMGKVIFYAYKPLDITEITYLGYSLWTFDCSDSIKIIAKTVCH